MSRRKSDTLPLNLETTRNGRQGRGLVMILKESLDTGSCIDHKKFVRIHACIQIYLLLAGVSCCVVSYHLINNNNISRCQQSATTATHSASLHEGGGRLLVCVVSLMTFGLMQALTSVILLVIHSIHGYIAKTGCILVHLVCTGLELVTCIAATTATGLIATGRGGTASSTSSIVPTGIITPGPCNNPYTSSVYVYGVPVVLVVLGVCVVLHLVVAALLLTVDFNVLKEESPPKIRLHSHRSPAIYIDRAQLKGLNNSTDLLRLHNVLRTRLPSLRSNHPNQPPSPGFLSSLDDLPLTPFMHHQGITFSLEESSNTHLSFLPNISGSTSTEHNNMNHDAAVAISGNPC